MTANDANEPQIGVVKAPPVPDYSFAAHSQIDNLMRRDALRFLRKNKIRLSIEPQSSSPSLEPVNAGSGLCPGLRLECAMDHDAASRLFYAHIWPHRAMVLRTARFLARDHAHAEDLAQETLVKAFKSIERFDANANSKGWISAILRNTWIDHLRAIGRQEDATGGALLSVEQHDVDVEDRRGPAEPMADLNDPAALLEQLSDEQLIKALRQLPEDIRWTLLLVDVEGLEHEQAAGILAIPTGTVKSRAHRGRRMMREMLLAGGMKDDGRLSAEEMA